MPRTLARKDPTLFKTLPLQVDASPDGLAYRSLGLPMNFAQMLERRRQPLVIDDNQRFSVQLANLGVSVHLTLTLHGQTYWLVVRQRRQDRGDTVLKLISGYVPAHELNLPLLTAIQEVAEECLIETPDGWLAGRFADTWLPTSYPKALHYLEHAYFRLSPLSGAARPVQSGSLTLLERPHAYVHLPTASLQLVYDLALELPREARQPSLFHVDEVLQGEALVASLERRRPDIYLLPCQDGQPTGELFTLLDGELKPTSTRGLWLSEGFAEQDGWLVRDERVRWKDWLARVGTAPMSRRRLAG